ncbi:hypothetical protein PFISCL1PPCAC_5719 [Pristionchus fissidentatus]|uniref:Uncharacterized protein n=1 Tax=Pristionchus fissidentatus TaxID=1538716 RepID=A0AAV5V499_9BILA|nr:hypothetical protein PFISCL1PPCAC_5719 [Pristionchus fissidentatus]
MSNHYNRDNQGGWNGGFQQGGGGFAAHNVQHRYQEDDYASGYQSQSQNQRNQAPLYARGSGSYPRGTGNNAHSYGSHRGHPQMGHHQQSRRDHQQHGYEQNGFRNVNVWPNEQSSRGVSSSQGGAQSLFGGFNPNAPVFTPSAQHAPPGNDYMGMQQQQRHNYAEQNSYFPMQPSYYPPMSGQLQMPYGDMVDEETAAYEAMYSNQQEPQQFVPSQELLSLITKDAMSVRIQEVLVGLEQIMADPDDYESWSGAIRERIVMLNDDQRSICVRVMLEMLISSSATETPSLPHAGHVLARLVEMVAKEIPSSVPTAILPNLQVAHFNRNSNSGSERAALVKFMAEVFDRIETAGGAKIEALGMAVLEQSKEMIKPDSLNEQRLKDVIDAIKMAGPGLDSMPATRAANDELLTLLSAFGKGHPKLSECTKNEIAVLIEQRESGWASRMHGVSSYGQLSSLGGQLGGGASSSSSSSLPSGCIVGHDGKPLSLSEEERLFLDEQFGLGDENEEDEIMREMDKFMREEKEKKQAEATQRMMEKLNVCEEKKEDQA